MFAYHLFLCSEVLDLFEIIIFQSKIWSIGYLFPEKKPE